jgi:undecaprenyl-diphosphatase
MTFFQSLILGIIQGLTEYLPISSSAHLVLVPYLLNWNFPTEQIFPFDVLVQLGTLVAVILYFWKDLVSIVKSFFLGLINKEPFKDPQARLGWYLILATIPAGLAGLLFKSQVEAAFSAPRLTAYFLFGTAVLLILADLVGKRTRQLEEITWWDALWIGLFQAVSLFPGISRSGATISGGMTHNLDRSSSARFSFLISIPVMLGAGLVSLKDLSAVPNLPGFLPMLVVGFIAAVIVGYLSIHWFLDFIKRQRLWYFAVYCILLASAVLIVASIRATSVQASATPSSEDAPTADLQLASSQTTDFQIINLQYSNSLDWLIPTMTSCANLLQKTALVTHNLPADEMSLKNADLILRWGSPAPLNQTANQLGLEQLVLAANNDSPLNSLSLDAARRIFDGEITTWGNLHSFCPDCLKQPYDSGNDGKSIVLNFYPPEEDIQTLFIQKVMLGQPVAAEIGLLVPDASAMRESISGNANVIGFLPVNSLNSSVREITLNGSDPSTLQIPILAITSAQPQGKIKEWLLCLQKVLNP